MRDYRFKLLVDGNVVGEGYGSGHSAVEAFENGVDSATVFLPCGQSVEVVALSSSGLGIKFEAERA